MSPPQSPVPGFGDNKLACQACPATPLRLGRLTLYGDVRPDPFGIDAEPFFESGLGVRLDCVDRTFRLANTAIDAFIRVDDHVLALVDSTTSRADAAESRLIAELIQWLADKFPTKANREFLEA
jgi:hypothetical protein